MAYVMIVAKNAHLSVEKQRALSSAIAAAATVMASTPGYPPALAPVSVAQFLLESAWGTSHMGEANNYFGIKARGDEPYVTRPTWEVIKGQRINVEARFRKFADMADCFASHARLLLTRTRSDGSRIYAKALAHATDPIAFAHALTGVYATDPEYGRKLESIMRSRGLLETFGFGK
jgi:flagellum-specific peptidoglycan hydrolase FlgJ